MIEIVARAAQIRLNFNGSYIIRVRICIRANTYAHVAAAGLNFYSSYFSIALHTAEQYRGTRIRRIHSADPGEFICSDETEKAIPKKRIFAGNTIRSGLQKKSAAVMANLLNRR